MCWLLLHCGRALVRSSRIRVTVRRRCPLSGGFLARVRDVRDSVLHVCVPTYVYTRSAVLPKGWLPATNPGNDAHAFVGAA